MGNSYANTYVWKWNNHPWKTTMRLNSAVFDLIFMKILQSQTRQRQNEIGQFFVEVWLKKVLVNCITDHRPTKIRLERNACNFLGRFLLCCFHFRWKLDQSINQYSHLSLICLVAGLNFELLSRFL